MNLTAVIVTLASLHIPRGEFCEANPGAFAQFNTRYHVGAYHNSKCRTSIAGYYTHPLMTRPLPVEVFIGGATGYSRKYPAVWIGGAMIHVSEHIAIMASAGPTRAVVGFTLTYKIK